MSFPIDIDRLKSLVSGVNWQTAAIDGSHLNQLQQLQCALPVLSERAVEKRRNEFYAGRWCAAACLHELKGRWIIPSNGENRAPVWPVDFCGSISHTNSWAVAAVSSASQYRSIGIDLESKCGLPGDAEWRALIAKDEEIDRVSRYSTTAPLALIFSAKESLFKALNPVTDVFFDFCDARVADIGSGEIRLTLCRSLDAHYAKGDEFVLKFVDEGGHVLTCLALKP